MSTRFLILTLAVLALVGCDAGDVPASPAFLRFETTSTYVRTFTVDSGPAAYVDTFAVAVGRPGQTVAGVRGLVEVAATSRRLGETERVWYRVEADALTEVAYACPLLASVPPARRAAQTGAFFHPVLPEAVGARTACSGEAIVWDASRVVYRFPLEAGQAWRWSPPPFRLDRRVVGEKTVSVAAGRYRAAVVETDLYADGDVPLAEWTDYVDPEVGLVLRVVAFEQEAFDEHGAPIGVTVRSVDRLERIGP